MHGSRPTISPAPWKSRSPSSNAPHVIERTFPAGVRVGSNGVFRIPDIAPKPASYDVALWYDANGNGVVDAGDWFGSIPCTQSGTHYAHCPAGGLPVERISKTFVLH